MRSVGTLPLTCGNAALELGESGRKWGKVEEHFSGPGRKVSGFLGSYLHQIDEKGRLSLPAPFRREVEGSTLVLAHAHRDCLSLFPQSTWSEVEARLREMLRRNPTARGYVLGVTAKAVEVVPDKQGRILVPSRLQEEADIDGTTLVVGAIDRIELWQPQRFDSAVAAEPDDVERFTHQIFG
jgi:MraZ protein